MPYPALPAHMPPEQPALTAPVPEMLQSSAARLAIFGVQPEPSGIKSALPEKLPASSEGRLAIVARNAGVQGASTPLGSDQASPASPQANLQEAGSRSLLPAARPTLQRMDLTVHRPTDSQTQDLPSASANPAVAATSRDRQAKLNRYEQLQASGVHPQIDLSPSPPKKGVLASTFIANAPATQANLLSQVRSVTATSLMGLPQTGSVKPDPVAGFCQVTLSQTTNSASPGDRQVAQQFLCRWPAPRQTATLPAFPSDFKPTATMSWSDRGEWSISLTDDQGTATTTQTPVPSRPSARQPLAQAPASTRDADNPTSRPEPAGTISELRLRADRQEYDVDRRVLTAEGNVVMVFRGGVLQADRLQVNVPNNYAAAEGRVVLNRGNQLLLGERLGYDLLRNQGVVYKARGEINLATSEQDLNLEPQVNPGVVTGPQPPLADRLRLSQPLDQITSPRSVTITLAGVALQTLPNTPPQGDIRRFRFEADRLDYSPEVWYAQNIRFTNDPLSPPQAEIRAAEATLTVVSPDEFLLETSQPTLWFEQALAIPIPQSRFLIRPDEIEDEGFGFGFDQDERGGFFVQYGFPIIRGRRVRWGIAPQILVQRAFDGGDRNTLETLGLVTKLNARFGPRTGLRAIASFASLDLSDIEDTLRASLRLRQLIGTHSLSLEASYRDRLFNGSLGFQDVQNTIGAVLVSPRIPLGDSKIFLQYQTGLQYVNADTDRVGLLPANRLNNRVGLGRFQASATLNRDFILWVGQEPSETDPAIRLRYTPNRQVSFLSLSLSTTGVTGFYTNGDNQSYLTGTVSLNAQFGNFIRDFFDYTGVNVGYSQTFISGESPFFFDRIVDTRTVFGGFVQQIYGPLRFGIQTAFNLDTRREISTDYFLEYSRRAYGVTVRYNPVLQIGTVGLRISDFEWTGQTEPFSGSQTTDSSKVDAVRSRLPVRPTRSLD